MESTELNKTTASPPPNLDKDAGKSPPPPPPKNLSPSSSANSHHRGGGGSDDDDDDDCSSASSVASSPSYKSRKPPKPEATQPPANQEMERSPSEYRIPASVFERDKSSAPGDWSVASNESLFSIHMGNMSFTNDHFMWRSGELGPPPAVAAPSTSEQMFCYSAHSSAGGAADMRSRELGIAEATMLEVIKENEGRPQPALTTEARNARRSAGSNHSNMSFAFSV